MITKSSPRFSRFALPCTIRFEGEMGEGSIACALFTDLNHASPALGATVAIPLSHLTPAALKAAICAKRRAFTSFPPRPA